MGVVTPATRCDSKLVKDNKTNFGLSLQIRPTPFRGRAQYPTVQRERERGRERQRKRERERERAIQLSEGAPTGTHFMRRAASPLRPERAVSPQRRADVGPGVYSGVPGAFFLH